MPSDVSVGPSMEVSDCRTAQCFRDTEVEDERVIAGDENVFRLDVAVNDSLRMRVTQCIGNFAKNLRRFLNRQLACACDLRVRRFSPPMNGIV